jgi:LuxR family maltose regulon positive regulatory protein
MDAALSSLKQAIVLGEPGGMLRSFIDLGPGLLPFLRQLSSEGIAPEYVARLLTALSIEEAAMQSQVSMISQTTGQILLSYDSTIRASLTNRELDVLILLSKRLTNKEIASELSLSPHTIKRHSISLYQKLGVKNRREAVVRAHALGLIST